MKKVIMSALIVSAVALAFVGSNINKSNEASGEYNVAGMVRGA